MRERRIRAHYAYTAAMCVQRSAYTSTYDIQTEMTQLSGLKNK